MARKTSLENVRVRPNDDLALNLRRKKKGGDGGGSGGSATSQQQRYSYAGAGLAGIAGIGVNVIGGGENGFGAVQEEEDVTGEGSGPITSEIATTFDGKCFTGWLVRSWKRFF